MRESGILLHITSLPSPYGIGTLGREAYRFVDFLAEAGQRYWQILPLNPTGYGNSPYQAFSTFAGNHYLIDLDNLIECGFLHREEVERIDWSSQPNRVDFGILYRERSKLLRKAFARFSPDREYLEYVTRNDAWLPDYALFMTLKEKNPHGDWQSWPEELRLRNPGALEQVREKDKENIAFHYFLQYLFTKQWQELRSYAKEKGVSFIGDVPIYVPLDSTEVWKNHQLFQLDENRRPKLVAGVPPDGFTAEGQLWGNPLYQWEVMKATGYRWWLDRLSAAAQMYDVIRLDHFRGFESYWAVPAEDTNACGGHWVKGPGWDFISVVRKNFPNIRFIAEDLGYLTEEVKELQMKSGYPGMKILEFAFDSREPSDYLPERYTQNSVCYTGTHDNMTMRQWFEQADPNDIASAKQYMGVRDGEDLLWAMIRLGMNSASDLFVAQAQDYLELGGEARMNAPGTLSDANWTWRAGKEDFTHELAKRIRHLTAESNRLVL